MNLESLLSQPPKINEKGEKIIAPVFTMKGLDLSNMPPLPPRVEPNLAPLPPPPPPPVVVIAPGAAPPPPPPPLPSMGTTGISQADLKKYIESKKQNIITKGLNKISQATIGADILPVAKTPQDLMMEEMAERRKKRESKDFVDPRTERFRVQPTYETDFRSKLKPVPKPESQPSTSKPPPKEPIFVEREDEKGHDDLWKKTLTTLLKKSEREQILNGVPKHIRDAYKEGRPIDLNADEPVEDIVNKHLDDTKTKSKTIPTKKLSKVSAKAKASPLPPSHLRKKIVEDSRKRALEFDKLRKEREENKKK
jgi:hypothetical protein